ncbi:FAD-dependent oxidoreductase, partial [Rhodococcus hoagii]|nr:FAD-dependent oxidoreductase [Prescottella equi]
MTYVNRPLQVAVVGAGPAGIHASATLSRLAPGTRIDLFERLPVPFGLVRYGVSPDHPRIEKISDALHVVLADSGVRLLCNVEIGVHITVGELRDSYDAVIVATGRCGTRRWSFPASTCRDRSVPRTSSPGTAATPTCRLHAAGCRGVAVIGAGNVA